MKRLLLRKYQGAPIAHWIMFFFYVAAAGLQGFSAIGAVACFLIASVLMLVGMIEPEDSVDR